MELWVRFARTQGEIVFLKKINQKVCAPWQAAKEEKGSG
jgi:hypothetical protein